MKYLTLFLTCILFYSLKSQGQDTIRLENSSFEADDPECGIMPEAWINRNVHNLPQSGVQPGCDGVNARAYHGDRFISLKTYSGRANDRIGQKLPEKALLEKGSTYTMSLYLAYSDEMTMPHPSGVDVSFSNPAFLQVIGYNTCLLYTSPSPRD